MLIGNRLRELRKQKQLTLDELAARCELSKGFLSQVENDLTSPSIQTLDDILEALGCDLKTFFQEAKDERIVFNKNDFYLDEQDDKTIKFIIPNAQKNIMEPIALTLKPNGKSDLCTPFDGEEFIYVLKGKVTLVYDEQKYNLKAHETAYFSSKHEHYLINEDTSECELIWVISPPNF